MAGIYVHIPFCKQACSYCDFYFVTKTDLIDSFCDALQKEIQYWCDSTELSEGIETLYFGGGTPSQLKEHHWKQILKSLQPILAKKSLLEFTVEVNPDDINKEYVSMLKDIGVDRLSMGVQSFDDELLRFMNRAHTSTHAKNAIEIIQEANFKSFTLDLIYGNPNQTNEALSKDLNQFISFSPPHLSAYSLTIEPKTRLGKAFEHGKLIPLDEEIVSDQFELVRDRLESVGLKGYEVSNFAISGHEAIHNSNYWKHKTYLGFGPGAHSLQWQADGLAQRWTHHADLKEYIKNPIFKNENIVLSKQELAEERLLIGLRTREGVTIQELNQKYEFYLSEKQDLVIQKLKSFGLLNEDKNKLVLTRKGLVLADRIVFEIISA